MSQQAEPSKRVCTSVQLNTRLADRLTNTAGNSPWISPGVREKTPEDEEERDDEALPRSCFHNVCRVGRRCTRRTLPERCRQPAGRWVCVLVVFSYFRNMRITGCLRPDPSLTVLTGCIFWEYSSGVFLCGSWSVGHGPWLY